MTKDTGGPAFPRDQRHGGHNGMTLRDYFAAMALQGILAGTYGPMSKSLSSDAYYLADLMLEARK